MYRAACCLVLAFDMGYGLQAARQCAMRNKRLRTKHQHRGIAIIAAASIANSAALS
jgi:hypothetical protein